jgi:predicted butyrate kinase (DUF1464 family)
MPRASPPKVIMLRVVPLNLKKIKVTKIDKGIARKMIIALLVLRKNIRITIIARKAPSIDSCFNPFMDCLI